MWFKSYTNELRKGFSFNECLGSGFGEEQTVRAGWEFSLSMKNELSAAKDKNHPFSPTMSTESRKKKVGGRG